jgi:hypothetical protein
MTQANILAPGLVSVAPLTVSSPQALTAEPHSGSCAVAETYPRLPQ